MLLDDREYHVHHGDNIPFMADMPENSIDMCLYSPPFPAVFSYTPLPEDFGNAEEESEIKIHLSFLFRAVLRVMKPGRVMAVHCKPIVLMKRSGKQGIYDFPGLLIRLARRAGWVYDHQWMIRNNPQAQAITTKSRALQFSGLESDRAQSRGSISDYVLKFLSTGSNEVPIDSDGQLSRNDWIKWAEPLWDDIRMTDTLNVVEARSESDTRHICALPLPLIDRLVRLYSNPGEIVFDPFTGIGSTGYVALKHDRRFMGCELKDEYHAAALKNLARAVRMREERTMGSLFATV